MPTWSESPLESRWERRLPKVLWRWFCVRLAKYAMLRSRGSSNIFRSCSAGEGEWIPGSETEIADMGTFKALLGFLAIIGVIYAGFQIIPPELTNYSFQDDLRNVAMVGGSNPHTTDQELVDSIIRKAQEHQITLVPE